MKKLFKSANPYSLLIILLLFAVIVLLRFHHPVWLQGGILTWDVFGYYLYLPFTFIYHDLGFKDMTTIHHIFDVYNPAGTFYQVVQAPNGNTIVLYTTGLAILFSPFFFIGHLFAHIFGYPADGYSMPYQASIAIGSLFYTIIGLVFIRKVLLRFFTDKLTVFILICLVLGTNYLELTFLSGVMPHNYLFAIYALILWLTIRWHETHKYKDAAFLGLLMGIAALVRASEIISFLIPLLWGIHDKESLIKKWQIIKKYKTHLLLLVACVGLMALPQMIYWKIYAGKFIFWSYGGESFDFLKPNLYNVLFSYKKGWLLYTPLMILAIFGFRYIYRNEKKFFYPLFIYFAINLWIVSSWSCWWYGGSFSQRSLMQSYAVMAIPLGYFFLKVISLKKIYKYPLILLTVLLVALNLFQTWQYTHYIIDPIRMTKEYYWKTFLKTTVTDDDRKLLAVERAATTSEKMDTISSYYQMILLDESFEMKQKDKAANYCDTIAHAGKQSFFLDSNCVYSPGFSEKYSNLTCRDYMWIKASVYVYPVYDPKENPLSVINCDDKGKSTKYRAFDIETGNLKLNTWNLVTFAYQTPEIRSGNEKIQVYLWLRGKKKIFIDDLNVSGYIPKGKD